MTNQLRGAQFPMAALTIMVLLFSASGRAWDTEGHMMVAFIAYQKLSQPTRDRVDALIMLNPDFAKLKSLIPSSVPKKDRPAMLFMLAATWPDRIKSKPGFTDDGTDHGNRPSGPTSSQNIGYDDKFHHKYWHFVDTPFSRDGASLPQVPDPNAQTRIHLFRTVLASTTEKDPLKSYDLVWLLHLVGDVHQPLHSSTRVRQAQPNGDGGGNLVSVCTTSPCSAANKTLHAFWDEVLGTAADVTAAASAAKKLAPADSVLARIKDEGEWVKESFDLAQGEVYKPPVHAGTGPFTLTASYRNGARNLAAKRVALAGARLANLLNAELK